MPYQFRPSTKALLKYIPTCLRNQFIVAIRACLGFYNLISWVTCVIISYIVLWFLQKHLIGNRSRVFFLKLFFLILYGCVAGFDEFRLDILSPLFKPRFVYDIDVLIALTKISFLVLFVSKIVILRLFIQLLTELL